MQEHPISKTSIKKREEIYLFAIVSETKTSVNYVRIVLINEKILKKKIHLLKEEEFPKIESRDFENRWKTLQKISEIYESENKNVNDPKNLGKVNIVINE
jgi:hypothetical protein